MAEKAFPLNATVKIDGRGKAVIIEHKGGEIYSVRLDGIDFEEDLPAERLSLTDQEILPGSNHKVEKQTNNSNRFMNITNNDVSNIVTHQQTKSTAAKTFYDMKLLANYLQIQNESRGIHEIPPPELSEILCKFFLSVRKPDGSNYEPVSLRSFQSSFDRHLRNKNYGCSIIHGIEFAKLKQVIQAKQKELKRDGRGNLPNRADPITDLEIQKLWDTNQLGTETPDSIINSLWFFNTVSLGLRGSDEHRDMCWGDVKLCTDESGHEYLEFEERQTKTRQGSNPRDVRQVKPKMWANLDEAEKCPVAIYKLYVSLRPADYCHQSDPYYIATHTRQQYMKANDQWFKRQPIGKNKLTSIMKRMATSAGLPDCKRLTNHSARKHLVQKLSDHNVPANQIMQITGHKNIHSVNNYSHLSEVQHRNISGILTNAPAPNQLNQFNLSAKSSTKSATQSSHIFHGGLNTMFAGSIFGGTFNVNISSPASNVQNIDPCSPQPVKRRRIILSDSDSE